MMTESYILFTIAGTAYALRTRDVAHVEMVEQITGVPNAAHFVEGVVFSRGQVVPALNLRARFGFQRIPHDLRTRLLVAQCDGRSVGLIVDSAREFMAIPSSAVQPPNQALAGISGQYIEGIANLDDRLILILSLPAVLDFSQSIPAA
jgi:purine-binding chemotaxis protein CheW